MPAVRYETREKIAIVTIDRPEVRNAVDGPTAAELADAFRRFEADDALSVAILTGANGTFCAGADLKAVSQGRGNRLAEDGDGPMGPSRMLLSKPVVAAVEGWAVAGGIELAVWCVLRVAARDATFGVYCRRWGVPLCDGGTIRLPRLIGQSHALDMILTGRGVSGDEALRMGLANRLVEPGAALAAAIELRPAELLERSDSLAQLAQSSPSWFRGDLALSVASMSAPASPPSPATDEDMRTLVRDVVREELSRDSAGSNFGADDDQPIIAAMSMEASSPMAPPRERRTLRLPPSIQAALPPWLTEPAHSAADLAIQSVVLEKLHRLPADTEPETTQRTINNALDHLIEQARLLRDLPQAHQPHQPHPGVHHSMP